MFVRQVRGQAETRPRRSTSNRSISCFRARRDNSTRLGKIGSDTRNFQGKRRRPWKHDFHGVLSRRCERRSASARYFHSCLPTKQDAISRNSLPRARAAHVTGQRILIDVVIACGASRYTSSSFLWNCGLQCDASSRFSKLGSIAIVRENCERKCRKATSNSVFVSVCVLPKTIKFRLFAERSERASRYFLNAASL